MTAPLSILYQDRDLLLVNKSAGMATMGAGKYSCLIDVVREFLAPPTPPFVGIVSRLDAPVSGIVPVAKNARTAHLLSEQIRLGTATKIYRAIVQSSGQTSSGTLTNWLLGDKRRRKVHVVDEATPGARRASLSYRTLYRSEAFSILEIELHSGRKHQIRVQLAEHGLPIVGDRKYGGLPISVKTISARSAIALHARQLRLAHPAGVAATFIAPLPDWWKTICGG